MRRDTELQHFGEDRDRALGSVAPPVYRTSLFTFRDTSALESALRGEGESFLYSRVSNPTVRVLEEKVARLEAAEDAVAFSSGMAAVSAVFLTYLSSGGHLVINSAAYGPTLLFVRDVLEPLGIEVTRLDPAGFGDLERHLRPSTRLVYLESPASITFEITDLETVTSVTKARGIPAVADNSWATPLYQRPIELGTDLALHSGTKYLAGHSDILLGLVAGKRDAVSRVRRTAILLGACLSPEDAFLAVRGLRTLSLRMARHRESALMIFRRLLLHPRVLQVLHPEHPFFPTHPLWLRQFSGSSGLFSFLLDGDSRRFCDALQVFSLGVSWGGFESLALPALVLPESDPERGVRPRLPRSLIRLSIGLEDPEDLWEDLERGFAAVERAL